MGTMVQIAREVCVASLESAWSSAATEDDQKTVQPWGLELDVVVDIEVHMTREVWKGEVNVLVKELRISMISVIDGGQMREVREPTLNRKQAEKGFRVDRMHMYVEKAISEIVFSACFHRGNF